MASVWQNTSRLCSAIAVVTKACLQSRQLLGNAAVQQTVTRCLDGPARLLPQSRYYSSSFRQQPPIIASRIDSTFNPIKAGVSLCHVSQVRHASSNDRQPRDYTPPSPFKNPGPRRYGYSPKVFSGGVLPRSEIQQSIKLPMYKDKGIWGKKKATFGQNDYIDILGDGNLHPSDLLKGPRWLVGFRGNELQRLTRRMRAEGNRIRSMYPTKHHRMTKRIKYLYNRYNFGRISKYR